MSNNDKDTCKRCLGSGYIVHSHPSITLGDPTRDFKGRKVYPVYKIKDKHTEICPVCLDKKMKEIEALNAQKSVEI